jgi:hypothetical protein
VAEEAYQAAQKVARMEANVAVMVMAHLVAHESMMIIMEARMKANVAVMAMAHPMGKVAPSDEEDMDDFADFDDKQAALLVSFQSAQRNEYARRLMVVERNAL